MITVSSFIAFIIVILLYIRGAHPPPPHRHAACPYMVMLPTSQPYKLITVCATGQGPNQCHSWTPTLNYSHPTILFIVPSYENTIFMWRQSFICIQIIGRLSAYGTDLTEVILKVLNKGKKSSRIKQGSCHNENIFLKKTSLTMRNTRFVKVQHACGL